MERWQNVTLGEVFKGFARYRPFILTVIVIVLIGVVLPGTRSDDDAENAAASSNVVAGQNGGATTGGADIGAGGADGTDVTAADGSTIGGTGTGGTGTGGGRTGAGASGAAIPRVVPGGKSNPLEAADCDPATGRIRVPTRYAPSCVTEWPKGTNNGGATHRGVTATEIVVARRINPNPDPAAQAILVAGGDDDNDEQRRATRLAYMKYFEDHYQMYGRKVKLVDFNMSGSANDEQAARADAIKVATEIKAFAAWGGSGVYKDELVARGVLCIGCTTSEPIENYLKAAPYVWSTLLASTQAYILRAEYIAKKLRGNAKHAGDPTYQTQPRKFGLVWYDTAKGEYKAGINFFIKELGKYGINLSDNISYILDLGKAQEDARVIISRLKQKGITSVVFAGDPLTPIFLTKEANNQQYRPEWIVTGSALTDTNFFARTYDQVQWAHAFGVSALAIPGPREEGDAWRLHVWDTGKTPPADQEYAIIYSTPFLLYTGIHMAGPKLTPETFRDGMFAYPTSGAGGVTSIAASFGRAGKLWPWDDYLLYDDMSEIWWDPTARDPENPDDVGMYRYVDGGARYLPTEFPLGDTKAFQMEGTAVRHSKLPAGDQYPKYEHKHYHG